MKNNYQARSVFLCLAFCAFLADHAGAVSWWARTIAGPGENSLGSIQRTADGGCVMTGYTQSPNYDAWCVKLDSSGNISWQKTYGGINTDTGVIVYPTADGSYMLAGNTESFGAGGGDIWCLKLDPSGNISWQKTYGGINDDYLMAVHATPDGGWLLVGWTYSFGAGGRDGWCVKIDASGNISWQKAYGGAGWDEITAVESTSDGGYIVVGNTYSFGAGSEDAWCMKLNASGNIMWEKTYGGSSADVALGVNATGDGGYILGGQTESFGAGGQDVWCVKINASGNVLWQKTYGGGGKDGLYGVNAAADGGPVFAGYTYSSGVGGADAWCVKLNASGDILWQKTYGGLDGDYMHAVQPSSDGGYLYVGRSRSFSDGSSDGLCFRLDSAGTIDASCANLALNSNASVIASTAIAIGSSATITPTVVAGTPTSAIAVDSTAAMTVLCSGGTPGPTITSISSKTSKPGSSATIYGTGFSTDKKKDVIYFGTRKVKSISRAKATSLKLTIPKVKKGTVGVYVVANGQTSNAVQFEVK